MSAPTLDRVLDAIIRVDAGSLVQFVSEHGVAWFGGPEAVPKTFIDALHPDDLAAFKAACGGTSDQFGCDVRILRKDGACWANVRGYRLTEANQCVLCIVDISAWKNNDATFRHAAEHDELTGLPNRMFLKNTVERLIRTGERKFSIALLDLDGFKQVNDTFGHAMGDAVLIETTKRLNKLIGADDVFARLGGDEFVLMLIDRDAATACLELTSVLLAIARPYDTAPHNAYLGVSIGVAEYPAHGQDYSTVLKNADTAMYHSKNAGKNRISIYTETSNNQDFSITAAIHDGIQEGEFYLEYQPQFDMERRIVGAEALMRWTSRTFGRMAPDKFIPIVEDAALMPFLGRWALRYACHQLRQFQALMPDFVMSVNVSPVQFGADDFDALVLESIAEAGIDPTRLILEITESTLMHSQAKTERALAKLREQGIRFSIDDFGTGFSSLAYLTRLPVSSIKIDKAFVRAIEDPDGDVASDKKLITAMIDLAHGIDLKVVAEGVETSEQFAFLQAAGCNLIQGYLLGKPMPAAALSDLLGTRQRVAA